jgi:hypothetical protein
MDHRVLEHYNDEPARANIKPRLRRRALQRYRIAA